MNCIYAPVVSCPNKSCLYIEASHTLEERQRCGEATKNVVFGVDLAEEGSDLSVETRWAGSCGPEPVMRIVSQKAVDRSDKEVFVKFS